MRFLLSILIIVLILAGGLTVFSENTLELKAIDRDEIFLIPVSAGLNFEIDYIHSVDHTPVKETYEIQDNGKFILREVSFQSYGVGIPSMAPRGVIFDGKWTRYPDFNLELDNIRIRLGTVESISHRLHIYGKTIPLVNIGGKGNVLSISVRRHPKIVFMWRFLRNV